MANNKSRCFIVTVGASLIEKYNEEQNKVDFMPKTIERLQNKTEWGESEWSKWREKANYKDAKNKILKWQEGKNNLEDFRKCSAELNSLYHIKPVPGKVKGDKVVLIATRTPVGLLCSELLKKALTEIEINNSIGKVKLPEDGVFIIYPEGLGKAGDDIFITTGLPNFISDLSKQIQEHSEKYEVIIIPTGGYKSLIPYATLAGILHGKEIKYIYEESDKLMSLPSIPVNLDIEKWQPAYIKMEILTNQPAKNTKSYYENLDESFRNLLEPPSDEKQAYKFNAMGEFLKQRYIQLKYQTPLQFQTAGTSLLRYLKLKRDEDKPDLQEFFSQLVKIGPYLWLGDKVPEMAEHALHHHTNLFEIAEIFLLPILDNQEDFLSAEELFVLLCTIYFHDWGHVISELNGKPLLPIQIRDFHHILGYERLNDREWRKKLIELGLKWVGDKPSNDKAVELWKKYLKLIAIIGLFHRKKMPLLIEGNHPYLCPVNNKKYEALERQATCQKKEDKGEGWFLQFEGKTFSNKRAVLIASLFRIIDSLDNQVARMGIDEEIRMKAAVVQRDTENEENRKKKIKEMINRYFNNNNNLKTKIDALITKITGGYQGRETTGNKNTNKIKSEELDLEEEVRTLLDGHNISLTNAKFAKSLIHLYIDVCCWTFFKKEQPKHYLKHLALKNLKISYQYKQNKQKEKINHKIDIKFICQEQEKLKEYCEIFGLDPEKDLPDTQKIIDDIKGEYCSKENTMVKSILNSNFVEISYQQAEKR